MSKNDVEERPHHPVVIRSGAQSSGDTTFVDYDNLHPVNETSAVISGAATGGTFGAMVALCVELVRGAAHDAATDKVKFTFGKVDWVTTSLLVGVPAVVTGITSLLSARTHNDWSKRVLESIERQKQAQNDQSANR